MHQRTDSATPSNPFPPQQAYLAIELPPADRAEKRRLLVLRRHVQAHPTLPICAGWRGR
ncbi:hypothetical protein IC235_16105 [Hymenobacter sp. BT664]|uniref:Uncharacterized protein n=1 Tax=Hymenobacter montanus TaxID=2771359 RepID=A0A927BG27_9BACT|nr:hypothetical protein [Hymenobacter montanus]MBD2769413.1 hypothetical protein [Hymenobacter montanus]